MCAVCAVESRTLAEQRRLDDALAEVERLRAENARLVAGALRLDYGVDGSNDYPTVRCLLCGHYKPGTDDAGRIEHAENCPLGAEVPRLRRGSRRAESIGRDPCHSWPMPPDACW